MPRFQAAESLRRVVPGATRAIPSADRSGQIIAASLADAGQTLAGVQDRHDQFALNKARSDLLAADIEARKAFEQDTDFETHEERYREAMGKARDVAGQSIKTPGRRAEFDLLAKDDIERGALAVYNGARQKRGDQGRADLDSRLAQNRTAALNARDAATRTALIDASRGLVTSAADEGFIDRETAESTWQAWQGSYAEGYAAMLPAEEREAALKDPKNTPLAALAPDKRALLLRAAESENKETRVRGASQEAADQIWAAGGSMESMRKKARAIDDPNVRDATIAQLEARRADIEADREITDRRNREAAWRIVLEGGTREDIPAGLWTRMNPEDGIRISNYLRERASAPIKTDSEVYYLLRTEQSEDPKAFAGIDLLTYRDRLSEEDFEGFVEAQQKIKDNARVPDSTRTDLQMVNSALAAMGIKTGAKAKPDDLKRAADFTLAFDRARQQVAAETGRPATPEDKQRILDTLSMETVRKRDWWFDEKKPLFETQVGEDIELVVPDQDRTRIIAAYRKKVRRDPSEAEIQALYRQAKGL